MIRTRTIPQAVFDNKDNLRASAEGHRLACAELARKHPSELDVGNPNHPINDGIFGHDTEEFMRKQYK
ncbi:MAG: hypothetical protein CMP20_04060 [Rickettsiales bacterium]|nr:hypothetical protein [Rickettsiales bacterium]